MRTKRCFATRMVATAPACVPLVLAFCLAALGSIEHPAAMSPDVSALSREAAEVPIADESRVDDYLRRLFHAFPGPVTESDVIGMLGPELEGPVLHAIEVVGLPATPYLLERLSDPDPRNRELAVLTIGNIGDDSAVPALEKALRDAAPKVRARAAWALGSLRATEAVAALARRRRDTDWEVRMATAWALGNLRVRAAVGPLTELLQDKDRLVRATAAEALGGLGCTDPVPSLIPLLQDSDEWVRYKAAGALRVLTFGIVTAAKAPYDRKSWPRGPLHNLAVAYREFWRTHKEKSNDELMREAIGLRIHLLRPKDSVEEYYEIREPLEKLTFQSIYAASENDPMSLVLRWREWWARNRNTETWEWALQQTEWPAWPDLEDSCWGAIVREGAAKAIPVLAGLGQRDTRFPGTHVQLLKHLTLLDLGFGKPWATDDDRRAAAKAWQEWYSKHRNTWDVRGEMRRALPTAQGEDFWIAVKTLRWLGDFSAVPYVLKRADSRDYAEREAASKELQRLTGRQIGCRLHTWESDVQRANYAANWRLWWERNAERFRKREPPLPLPRMKKW